MIAKKYLGAVIALLLLLGFYEKQTPVPNQEIELHFSDHETSEASFNAIVSSIKSELQDLGVTEISVGTQTAKTLKISYFSKTHVAVIKQLLAKKGLISTQESAPTEQNTIVHIKTFDASIVEMDIYELESVSGNDAGIHGKYIVNVHKSYDKSPDPNFSGILSSVIPTDFTVLANHTQPKIRYQNIAVVKASYEIPEVRAGPFTPSFI